MSNYGIMHELRKINPDTTVFIGYDHLTFQNMYVPLDGGPYYM